MIKLLSGTGNTALSPLTGVANAALSPLTASAATDLDKYIQYLDDTDLAEMSMNQFNYITNLDIKHYSMLVLIRKHGLVKAHLYAKQAGNLQTYFNVSTWMIKLNLYVPTRMDKRLKLAGPKCL